MSDFDFDEPDLGWSQPYSPDQFNALVADVDRQGGALLPEPCQGRTLKYPKARGKGHDKAETCSCGNESMAVITYDLPDSKKLAQAMRDRGAGFARVCLVCDYGGLWPRFIKAVGEAT